MILISALFASLSETNDKADVGDCADDVVHKILSLQSVSSLA